MTKLTNNVVIEKAKQLGFDLVGFSHVDILGNESKSLMDWIERGYHASMGYMENNFNKRKNPKEIMPEAKSIISLALNYYSPEKHSNKKESGKISRYAWGKDYHLIIWQKLDEFETLLKEIEPDFKCLTYVDTGPVMDKVWAIRSGLGWMGKHTNVINQDIGSWFFIATVLTNYIFDYSKVISDYCGTCTACIDACPTGAILQEYLVDSNKCISYQTIENKREIPIELKGKFDNWIFGCDICQDVCPWNQKFSVVTSFREFYPRNKELMFNEVMDINEQEFRERFADSPIKRTKLSGLQRNARYLFE